MDSTSAYQGAGRNIGAAVIDEVQQIVLGKHTPDLTIFFDVDRQISLSRMKKRDTKKDRLEQETDQYREQVEKGYQELIKLHKDRFVVIDANQELIAVIEQVKKVILERLK
jgi:dTMP kinase